MLQTDALESAILRELTRVGTCSLDELSDRLPSHSLNEMIAAGIKGVLNFAPIRLNAPEGVIVNNVNVGVELETVIYSVNALKK